MSVFTFVFQSVCAQVQQVWMQRYPEGEFNIAVGFASILDQQGNLVVTGMDSLASVTIKYEKQRGDVLWMARYAGGAYTQTAAVDADGHVYVAGGINQSATGHDFLTIKFDGATGHQLWAARYNGPINGNDSVKSLVLDRHGNVYIAGFSHESGNGNDYVTIKYNGQTGQQLWTSRHHSAGSASDVAWALTVDQAGDVFVTGTSGTIKYDGHTGQMLWGPKPGIGYAIAADQNGDIFVAGGGSFYAMYKFNGQTGQLLWIVSANNPGGTGSALAVDEYGDVYMTGSYSTVNSRPNRCLVIKYSGQNGSVIWSRELLGTCHALKLDQENNVYVAGTSYRPMFPGPAGDFRSAKLDGRTGALLWEITHYNMGEARSLQVDGEGNVYVAGNSGVDWPQYLTIKYEQSPPGDVNYDFCVDDGDLLCILDTFGQSGDLPEDVNRDGVVDDKDLLTVLFNFGRGCRVD
jgi:hypothetical protein